MSNYFSRNKVVIAVFVLALFIFTAWYKNLQATDLSGDDSKLKASLNYTEVLDAKQCVNDAKQCINSESSTSNVEQEKIKRVKYKIRAGDTISGIWKKHGSDHDLSLKAAEAIKAAGVSLGSVIRTGEVVNLELDREDTIVALKKAMNEGRELRLKFAKNSNYDSELFTPKVVSKERTVSAHISGSFAEAVTGNDLPYELVDELVDIFSARIEFSRDIQKGDSFAVIYEERFLEDGTVLSPGPIFAASFVNRGEHMIAIRQLDKEGHQHYFDENGKPVGNYFLRYPLKFTRISSVFSKSRFHPVLKRSRPHHGVDFAAPTGTPVRSVADGTVIEAGYSRSNGNYVKIKHTNRYSTAYLHLSKISSGVRKWSRVKRGQLIGKVGSTGLSTGPHLHFSFYDNGKFVDPLKVKLPSMSSKLGTLPETILVQNTKRLKKAHDTLLLLASEKQGQGIG